jgi:hypothetical protein
VVKREFNGDVKVRTALHFSHSDCTHYDEDDDCIPSYDKTILISSDNSDNNDKCTVNDDANTNNEEFFVVIIRTS